MGVTPVTTTHSMAPTTLQVSTKTIKAQKTTLGTDLDLVQQQRSLTAGEAATVVFGVVIVAVLTVIIECIRFIPRAVLTRRMLMGLIIGIALGITLYVRPAWFERLRKIPEDLAWAIGKKVGPLARAARKGFNEGYEA
ncbi:hypothetical protein BDV96DRAFT_644639 [Lophiotrema nucula]|uniref:Uncharacterized protein n=1 Tax=Lophiotrema nucula TaxID=690887 RepID=A0A6A5ZEQ0_9PLEO|nr:hypothetical protein BDV96DRAFT_644639 [Lophiotrema nucula]